MTILIFRYYGKLCAYLHKLSNFIPLILQESQSDAAAQADGDPELLDDSEFYQQLLKEFFETIDPTSSGKTVVAYIFIYPG